MNPTQEDVAAQVASGIPPIDLRLTQVNSCTSRNPIAYRGEVVLHSLKYGGLLPPEIYTEVAEKSDRIDRITKEALRVAMALVEKFIAAERTLNWLSIPCPISWLERDGIDAELADLMRERNFNKPERLVLSFPETVLLRPTEKTVKTLMDLKILGVQTMMTGAGSKHCLTAMLMDLPFDMVILSPDTAPLINNPNHPTTFATLCSYLASMELSVVADGVLDGEQVRTLSRAECAGYTPSETYDGRGNVGKHRLTPDEALAQQEDVD